MRAAAIRAARSRPVRVSVSAVGLDLVSFIDGIPLGLIGREPRCLSALPPTGSHADKRVGCVEAVPARAAATLAARDPSRSIRAMHRSTRPPSSAARSPRAIGDDTHLRRADQRLRRGAPEGSSSITTRRAVASLEMGSTRMRSTARRAFCGLKRSSAKPAG